MRLRTRPPFLTYLLHQSLIQLQKRPEILSLHDVCRAGRRRQLHLKIRALCGKVEEVLHVLVNTGAQDSLVQAELLRPQCLTTSRRPVRPRAAKCQYLVGGTKEAEIRLQVVNHGELSRPALGKVILLKGKLLEAQMDWNMIIGYHSMIETDSGFLRLRPL